MFDFYKYQGTGNDFVIVDNRERQFKNTTPENIHRICDRRFGVGADGFMLLEKLDGYDFKMVYYNADGNEGSMCGNGGRCMVAFAKYLNIIDKTATFFASDGVHRATIDNGIVSLEMKKVDAIERIGNDFFLDTGSPHYIIEVENIRNIDIIEEARKVRYNKRFKEKGTNVNFVQVSEGLKMRTYERGVEAETLACGTGATAVALVANYHYKMPSPVTIDVEGGKLQVSFEAFKKGYNNVWLKGPALQVFKGEWENF